MDKAKNFAIEVAGHLYEQGFKAALDGQTLPKQRGKDSFSSGYIDAKRMYPDWCKTTTA